MQILTPATAGDFPIGSIVPFMGTALQIPTGWQVCDGSNGTVDMSGEHYLGATTSNNVGSISGVTTSSINPNHTHKATVENTNISSATFPAHSHKWTGQEGNGYPNGAGDRITVGNSQSYPRDTENGNFGSSGHNHGTNITTSSKGTHSHNLTQPAGLKLVCLQRMS
jgi:hypothetical protein